MPNLREVKEQIQHIDALSKFLGWKEINILPQVLWEDEKIEGLIQGWYQDKAGVLVATDRRLIFVDKGWLFGMHVEDFPYDKVTSVQYDQGVIFGRVTIFAAGNQAIIEKVNNAAARAFANRIRTKMIPPKEDDKKDEKKDKDEVISKLERLAILRQSGILSEQEFIDQKKKILGDG